jgi:hypothetical protein
LTGLTGLPVTKNIQMAANFQGQRLFLNRHLEDERSCTYRTLYGDRSNRSDCGEVNDVGAAAFGVLRFIVGFGQSVDS